MSLTDIKGRQAYNTKLLYEESISSCSIPIYLNVICGLE